MGSEQAYVILLQEALECRRDRSGSESRSWQKSSEGGLTLILQAGSDPRKLRPTPQPCRLDGGRRHSPWRKLYLGHSAGDITGLYERRELLAWLEEDRERLRGYAGEVLMEQRPRLEVA